MTKSILRGVALASIAALTLSACATGARAPAGTTNLGDGRYGVYHFDGLPARNGYEAIEPAQWTPTEYQDLEDLDRSCHAQMDPQLPSAITEVARMGATVAVPSSIGSGLGAIAGFTGVTFESYAKYAGIASFGSGIGAGIDRVHMTRNYVQYACMQFAVGEARRHGRLRGIGIIPFPGVGSMRGVSMPNTAPSRGDIEEPLAEDRVGDDVEESFTPPPM